MVVGEDAAEFMERLGHDGGEIIFPHLSEPQCRRGHHIQEIIYWLWTHGHKVTPIQLIPMIGDPSGKERPVPIEYVTYVDDNVGVTTGPPIAIHDPFEENYRRFQNTINRHIGVIEGVTPGGKRHAVAFSRGRIYDPDGKQFSATAPEFAANGFHPDIAWVVE